ncbi:CRISPR-associated endonuclease Cas2 [Candidatus Gottesmanbacteria bacterium]|nr:CRISPR-associated endonuclease Cas2 [Candidatus Gottesmanbacteria bacterium]
MQKRNSTSKIKSGGKKVLRRAPYAKIDWEKAKVLFQKPLPLAEKHSYPAVKNLLHVLAAAGTIGLIFAFPGAAPALGSLILGNQSHDRWKTKQILRRLAKQKFIRAKENNDNTVTVTITKLGMMRALTYNLESIRLERVKKWDKKWRVVIFDIPEKSRRVRDVFRQRLQQLGLYLLQDSVYVSPYNCFNEIEFLRELYGVAFTVQYLLVEKLENDSLLQKHFELS